VTTIQVETSRPYPVHVGPGVLAGVGADAMRAGESLAILTDETVAELHLERLASLDAPSLAVLPGESSKTLAVLEGVLEFLAEAGIDRGSTLVALGGGVVGDLAGLAASLYMRGIDVVQCPTTLLAMVDAAIGGKTAVNLPQAKNLAGTVHQPRAVFADTETLATLPDAELTSGLGEVVKSALIGDPDLLELLAERAADILARDPGVLGEVVERCVAVKARVVAGDEHERGERQVLNLGHTFAHAIERVAGYGVVPHGVAVGAGLGLALRASERAGRLADAHLAARVAEVLAALGLPRDLDDLRATYGLELEAGALRRAMELDKKGRHGEPRFVLVCGPASLEAGVRLDGAVLDALLAPA
jgi:3-dehydroquinate synthase